MNQYFYEDQVYTVDKKGVKFGLVVENEVSFCEIFLAFFLFSPEAFSRLYELSIFFRPIVLSIKLDFLRSNNAICAFFDRFLAMGNTRIIPNRKSFYEKES